MGASLAGRDDLAPPALTDARAVYARYGRYLILDWGDACVSHPFFSMSVTVEGVVGWGADDLQGSVDIAPFRDAYLAPFAGGRVDEELWPPSGSPSDSAGPVAPSTAMSRALTPDPHGRRPVIRS